MSVYIITDRAADVCKIGYSQTPRKRLTMLRTSSAADLQLEAVIPGDRQCEADLHASFSIQHVKREWFTICPQLEVLIAAFPIGPRAPKNLIEQLGGAEVVSKALGTTYSAVTNWTLPTRSIPWRHRPRIAQLAAEAGIALPEGFLFATKAA